MLFIIHAESAKIVLKIFNVEVKTTAAHVCVRERHRWSQHRTLLDRGAPISLGAPIVPPLTPPRSLFQTDIPGIFCSSLVLLSIIHGHSPLVPFCIILLA